MAKPEMQPVESSSIAAVGYDPESMSVYIEFLHGGVYAYKGVPHQEYQNLLEAPSLGSYLNRNFKNVYPYERA